MGSNSRSGWEYSTGWQIGEHQKCPVLSVLGHHKAGIDADGKRRQCCYLCNFNDWQEPSRPRAFDHVYAIRRGTERGFLAMPYGLTDQDAAELTAWCSMWGFQWTLYGATGFHHALTVSIIVTAEPSKPNPHIDLARGKTSAHVLVGLGMGPGDMPPEVFKVWRESMDD